jgi:hypothetical protein
MHEKSVSIFVIRRDLVQMKRVKCVLLGDISINYKNMHDMSDIKLIYLRFLNRELFAF